MEYSASSSSDSKLVYVLGGFQLVCNAKHCEVYLTTETKDGNSNNNIKEEYLMTAKGLSFGKGTNGEEWQKAVCVIPGGPRPVLGLRVKLLSLKPSGDTTAKVQSMKLTARMPETTTTTSALAQSSTDTSSSSMPSGQGKARNATSPSGTAAAPAPPPASTQRSAPMTQADLGAAMASLSILARSTEDSMEKTMTDKFHHLENTLQTRWTALEQHVASLTTVNLSQRNMVAEQTKLMELQQSTMHAQSEQIQTLLEQQKSMTCTLQELRTEVTSLRGEVAKDKIAPKTMTKPWSPPLRIGHRPPHMDEEPVEGGIERTLSNFDIDEEPAVDDDNSDGVDGMDGMETPANGRTNLPPADSPASTNSTQLSNPDVLDPDVLEETEKIEVSLTVGGPKAIQGRVHEEKVENPDVPKDEPVAHPSCVNLQIPSKAFSFEDRNDKSEAKEAEAETTDNVQLEVMAGEDDDKEVEVLQSTTSDEYERSPPEVPKMNLRNL